MSISDGRPGGGGRDIFDAILNNPIMDLLGNAPVFCSTGSMALGGLAGEHAGGVGILVVDEHGTSAGALLEGYGGSGRVGGGGGVIAWDDGSRSYVTFATVGGKATVPGTTVGAGAEVGVFLTDGHYLGTLFEVSVGKAAFGLGIYGDLKSFSLAKNCGK